jgi:hypothetical protein
VFFRQGERLFFMYGFAKSERSNISEKEKRIFKRDARQYLSLTDEQIAALLKNGKLKEIK